MLDLDRIFDNVDLTALVESAGVKLRRSGRGWMGKCPFHGGDGESFSVYADDGRLRWHCFSECDADGDLFDFVARWQGLSEFADQLKWLADYAKIPLADLGWSTANAEEHKKALKRRDVLTRAARFFQRQLWSDDPMAQAAIDYARGRGFSDDHLRAAGWGFTRSDGALLQAMRQADDANEVIAQAREAGLIRADGRDFTANRDGDQVSPAGWLVYPHRQGDKTIYFSSRALSPIEHGSKSRNIPGNRQVYKCTVDVENKPFKNDGLVIVEGPADAETVRAWGWTSLALCGCSVREEDNPALVESLRRQLDRGDVYIALSNDEAGQRGAEKLADTLGPTAKLVYWPKQPGQEKSDANQWLQEGACADEFRHLLDESKNWIAILVNRADHERTEENIRAVVDAYARLNPFLQGMWKKQICRALDINFSDLEAMIRASGQDIEGELQQVEYAIRSGMTCVASYDERGRTYRVLCNFAAKITGEVVEDDGEQQQRFFAIAGITRDGRRLPEVEVEASEYAKMGWVLANWGAAAQIAAGSSTTDHLRAAILALSENINVRYTYAHTGWRRINGDQYFLSGNGAVGLGNVQVRLPPDMRNYRLPDTPQNVPEAIRASLRYLEIGDHAITIPLLAAMYLAPLAEIIPPAFTLWLFGTTGSLKSTATALAMCHFGAFTYNTPPASWTATANALEKLAYTAKDSPIWIDDFTAQNTLSGERELKRKADQLLRDWGNRAGKGRMNASLDLRRSFAPRGLIISTAEQLPPGQSIVSRLFALEISPESITRGDGSPLTVAQANDAPLYPHAMAGYVRWLASQWDKLPTELGGRLERYVAAARNDKQAHLRLPNNVATLFIGWDMFLDYALAHQVIDEETMNELRDEGWAVMIGASQHQQTMVTEENPVEMFINALRQMFAQGHIYLRNRAQAETETPDTDAWPAGREINTTRVGWYDESYWYLLPDAAMSTVVEFYRRMGVVFPDTARGLRAKLLERKIILASHQDRYLMRMRIGEERPYVLQMLRPEFMTENYMPLCENGDTESTGDIGDK